MRSYRLVRKSRTRRRARPAARAQRSLQRPLSRYCSSALTLAPSIAHTLTCPVSPGANRTPFSLAATNASSATTSPERAGGASDAAKRGEESEGAVERKVRELGGGERGAGEEEEEEVEGAVTNCEGGGRASGLERERAERR